MAVHEVKFTVPETPVGNADIEFHVKRDGEAFGRFLVSKGSLVWIPKNMTYGYRVSWRELDQFAREKGAREGRKAA